MRPEPAARHPAPPRSERAGRVLEQQHVRRHGALERLPVERPAEEVDGEDRLRPRRDRVVHLGEIEVERLFVDVDEHRRRAREPDDVRGRRKRVGRDDHLVALSDAEREHGEVKRRGAVRDGDRVLDPAGRRDERLELLDLRPHRQRARLEHGPHLRQLRLPELGKG